METGNNRTLAQLVERWLLQPHNSSNANWSKCVDPTITDLLFCFTSAKSNQVWNVKTSRHSFDNTPFSDISDINIAVSHQLYGTNYVFSVLKNIDVLRRNCLWFASHRYLIKVRLITNNIEKNISGPYFLIKFVDNTIIWWGWHYTNKTSTRGWQNIFCGKLFY